MKKYLFLCALILASTVQARIGCLHNSMELAVKKYDYKKYHPVACTCACEEQHVILPDGTCSECKHRRDYVFIQQVKTDPSKLINIAQLRKMTGQ